MGRDGQAGATREALAEHLLLIVERAREIWPDFDLAAELHQARLRRRRKLAVRRRAVPASPGSEL